MRILYLLSAIYIGLTLTACSTENTCPSCQQTALNNKESSVIPKSPMKVAFYTKSKPNLPYNVIGNESISKFNAGGNKRQEANIRDGMRELAAAMGGDAIINIKHNDNSISGTIVAYQENKENTVKS
jgi:hypothetical protein